MAASCFLTAALALLVRSLKGDGILSATPNKGSRRNRQMGTPIQKEYETQKLKGLSIASSIVEIGVARSVIKELVLR